MKNPIKHLREKMGVDRREYATMMGVHPFTLYSAERGQTRDPSLLLFRLGFRGKKLQQLTDRYKSWRRKTGK